MASPAIPLSRAAWPTSLAVALAWSCLLPPMPPFEACRRSTLNEIQFILQRRRRCVARSDVSPLPTSNAALQFRGASPVL